MTSCPINWSEWRGEIHATLMFIVKDGRILLIEKKRGLGAGKINGPGGKIDPGETPLQAVIRETREELLINPVHPAQARRAVVRHVRLPAHPLPCLSGGRP